MRHAATDDSPGAGVAGTTSPPFVSLTERRPLLEAKDGAGNTLVAAASIARVFYLYKNLGFIRAQAWIGTPVLLVQEASRHSSADLNRIKLYDFTVMESGENRESQSIQGKCSVRVFRVFRRSIQLGQKMNIFQKLTKVIFTKKYAEKMSKKS